MIIMILQAAGAQGMKAHHHRHNGYGAALLLADLVVALLFLDYQPRPIRGVDGR